MYVLIVKKTIHYQLPSVRYTEQLMQKSRAGEAWIGWNNEEEHKKSLVFTNLDGGYITPKRVYLHFESAAKEIRSAECTRS